MHRNINKVIGNEHPVVEKLQTGRIDLKKPLAKKTDWQEIEQLPGQDIRVKFQKKLGVEVDPALTFKKLEESLKYKICLDLIKIFLMNILLQKR